MAEYLFIGGALDGRRISVYDGQGEVLYAYQTREHPRVMFGSLSVACAASRHDRYCKMRHVYYGTSTFFFVLDGSRALLQLHLWDIGLDRHPLDFHYVAPGPLPSDVEVRDFLRALPVGTLAEAWTEEELHASQEKHISPTTKPNATRLMEDSFDGPGGEELARKHVKRKAANALRLSLCGKRTHDEIEEFVKKMGFE